LEVVLHLDHSFYQTFSGTFGCLDAATTCQQEADHSANGCATKLYGCGFELLPMSDGFSGQHVHVKLGLDLLLNISYMHIPLKKY
jgi:hypothetical protein